MRAFASLALAAALAAPLASAQTDLLWRTYVDGATTVETAPDGAVTVAGVGGITRLSTGGAVLWTAPVPAGASTAADIALGAGGEVYAVSSVDTGGPTGRDVLTYRINADGSFAWSQTSDGPLSGDSSLEWDTPKAIVVTSAGTVVTVSESGFPGRSVWTLGHGTDGAALWSRLYAGPTATDRAAARSAAVDCAGNVFVAGHLDRSDNSGPNPPSRNRPGVLLSYASDGTERMAALVFSRALAGPGDGADVWLNEVAADCATGAVYVAGLDSYNVPNPSGGRDIDADAFVARYDGTSRTWRAFPFSAPFSGSGNSSTSGVQNLAVGGPDDIYASTEGGDAYGSPTRVEVARLAADGTTAWLQTLSERRVLRPVVASAEGVTVVTLLASGSFATDRYEHFDPSGVLEWTFDRTSDDGAASNRAESMAAHPDGGVVWLETIRLGPTHVVRVGPVVPTARVQLIHAAAALAAFGDVEVYIDQPEASTSPDATVRFRDGSPTFTLPADSTVSVRLRFVTPPPGLPAEVTLTAGPYAPGRHVVSLIGMFDEMVPSFAANPDGISLLADLLTVAVLLDEAGRSTRRAGVPVVVANAATDAPALDVVVAETGETLADDLPYGAAVASMSLAAGTHRIEVRRASDQSVLEAVLLTVGGDEESLALTVSGFLDPAANQGGPSLTVAATDETGATDPGVVVTATDDAPAPGLVLAGPNPTRPGGAVRYTVPAGPVRLTVVDLLGREVAVLAEGERVAGTYTATLPALAPGLYVVRVEASGATASRRVAVVR